MGRRERTSQLGPPAEDPDFGVLYSMYIVTLSDSGQTHRWRSVPFCWFAL